MTTPQLLESFKLKNAWKYGCFVVTEEFLKECLIQGSRVDEWPFLYIESQVSELASSAFITRFQRASDFAKDSESYVAQHLLRGYNNVFSVMTELATRNPASLLSDATTNILLSLCCRGELWEYYLIPFKYHSVVPWTWC